MEQELVTRYVAVTNFSRRQPEFDGEKPFVWSGEDVTPDKIEALGWTPDEIEMYIATGALATFEEWVEIKNSGLPIYVVQKAVPPAPLGFEQTAEPDKATPESAPAPKTQKSRKEG